MRKDLMMLSAASVVMFGMTACGPDWDQMDPPAGGQVYSSLVKLASYTFDEGTAEPVNGRDFTMYAYDGGDFPTLAKEGSELENPRATQFLNLNGGYARVLNPVAQARSEKVAGSTSQDAVSLVFYVKQNAEHASTFKQTTLFSFQNADGTQQVAMTANGGLVVNGVDGDYSFNTSDEVTTGMLPADDEWHKVAVAVRNQNYFVYVDGEKRIDYTPQTSYKYSQIDMGKVVDFMAVAPYIYLRENSYETVEDKAAEYAWFVDDIDIYRNTITSKEWQYTKPGKQEESSGKLNLDYMPDGVVGYFLYNGSLANAVTNSEKASLVAAQAQGTESVFEEDSQRGTVWHQQEGWNGHGNGYAYLEIPNPLYGKSLSGATVSFWVKAPTVNWWDSVWGLTDEDGHMWYNANGYVGVNASGQWFDCQQDNGDNAIAADTWTQVTMVFSGTGFKVYYDGQEKFSDTNNAKWSSSGTIDYGNVLTYMSSCENMYFGHGSFWGAANAYISDLVVLDRAATAAEVGYLYLMTAKTEMSFFSLNNTYADAFNSSSVMSLVAAQAQGTESVFEEDSQRGTVWHQQEGWNGHGNGYAYLEIPNPLYGKSLSGATVSFWVKAPTVNWWDSVWGLTDEDGHMWYNANGYVGVNASGQWFDCQQDNGDNAIAADTWTQVTMVFSGTGFKVYYDGQEKFSDTNNAKWSSSGTIDYGNVLTYMSSCENMYFGHGSFWGAANAYISDLVVFPRALSASEVTYLYAGTKK